MKPLTPPAAPREICAKHVAYLIWCHCKDYGWDHTVAEVAEAIGQPTMRVRSVASAEGWGGRLRSVTPAEWHHSPCRLPGEAVAWLSGPSVRHVHQLI